MASSRTTLADKHDDDDVWASNRGNGTYHLTDDCPHVGDRHNEKPAHTIPVGFRELCAWCDPSVTTNMEQTGDSHE